MSRSPCVRCGMPLHTGEGRVTVSFTPSELADLAAAATDRSVRERLLCALGLVDQQADASVRADITRAS